MLHRQIFSSNLGIGRRLVSTGPSHALEHLRPDAPLQGLLSVEGLQKGWFDRKDFYNKRLNDSIGNNEEIKKKSLENIILEYGASATKRSIANYASLLFNLEFAMSSLRANPKGPDFPLAKDKFPNELSMLKTPDLSLSFANEPVHTGNQSLHNVIESSFGSIVQFRTLLLNSNLSISGDGFTWLVARVYKPKIQRMSTSTKNDIKFDKLFILNTYNAGSPFNLKRSTEINNLEMQYKNNLKELNKNNAQDGKDANKLENNSMNKESYLNDLLPLNEAKRLAFDNTTYIPLLAIDASPKMWLTDYGVFGKQDYLDRIWESINWNVVEKKLPQFYERGYN